jgi:DNA-binding SARP family transcriptional activator
LKKWGFTWRYADCYGSTLLMSHNGSSLQVRILGPIEVACGRNVVRPSGRNTKAVLAALTLRADDVVSVDTLIDALWRDPPRHANTVVHNQALAIRHVFEDLGASGRLLTQDGGYRLLLDSRGSDLLRFQSAYDSGVEARRAHDYPAAARSFRVAEGIWRGSATELGELGGNFQTDCWALNERRIAARQLRIESELTLGEHEDLLPELRELAEEHPFNEHVMVQYAVALYRSGRQTDALRLLRELRRAMMEDLGVDPGPGVLLVELAILSHAPELAAGPWPPRVGEPPRPRRLPRKPRAEPPTAPARSSRISFPHATLWALLGRDHRIVAAFAHVPHALPLLLAALGVALLSLAASKRIGAPSHDRFQLTHLSAPPIRLL